MKIGIALNHAASPASNLPPSYAEIRRFAVTAEQLGFESIWVFDHLLFRFGNDVTIGIWEAWTLLSALAESTKTAELGTLVLCNPLRNPALLAKMAHTLDEVSGGRLILGMGAGWHQPEFDAFGYDFGKRVDRLEEALQIVRPLLHAERVDFTGQYYRVQNCVIAPAGPRSGGIPLLVGARGERMLQLTARYADMWNIPWVGSPEELLAEITRLHAACRVVGRDTSSIGVTTAVQVALPNLGDLNSFVSKSISGNAEELAQKLRDFAQIGTAHIILSPAPHGIAGLEAVAEAVRIYRERP